MPFCLKLGLLVMVWFLVAQKSVFAVSIAEQTQNFGNQLNVWQAIQELGNNLSGTAQSFTFRVSTSKSNLEQFDHTAANTKIYDKSDNSFISGCTSSSSDPLSGLTFNTQGVAEGYQDVTIDFSCRNYTFTAGRRYLIKITNANLPNVGVGRILFASAAYQNTSNDYFTGGGLRYAFDNAVCNAELYVWNSQEANSGCNIWTTSRDDIYFKLTNTAPETKTPVIFIPGIGGSELKASQDIFWNAPDGHGGTFNHAYLANEKIWVNQDEAAKLGDDDYFDVLRLKADGVSSEADLGLTGSLTSFGYGDIDSFFTGLGYEKGKNFFVFPYDWRKDVRSTKDSLDAQVEEAKTKSGQTKVNLVVYSMGGLVARYYISDSGKAAKVNKLISMGVPHLGAPLALKTIMYGKWITADVFFIKLGVIPPSEVKDVFQNLPSAFQLLPSKEYYSFYDNSDKSLPHPFFDERDIDNNKVTGFLNFNQIKNLLSNLSHNMTVFNLGEQFHDLMDSSLNQNNGVKIYTIGGTGLDTIGQIYETWLIKWPIKLIPITDELKIDGDGTVPIYSAIPRNNFKDLTGATKVYYVVQQHSDMPRVDGISMQTVKAILNEDSLPVEVKDQKIDLEGKQVTVFEGELDLYDDLGNHTGFNDKGEIETNIPDTSFSAPENTRHAFIKKGSKKIKVKLTAKKKGAVNTKIRHYKQDKISKTTIYRDVLITETAKVEFDLDPVIETSPTLALFPDSTKTESTNITSTSEVTGSPALDQTPPTTKIDKSGTNPVTITLTGSDSDSGILKIEYSLDNGQTVQTYTNPFTISTSGKTTLQVKSIDKLGNEEIPQEVIIEISSSTSGTSSSNNSSSSSTSSTSLISNNEIATSSLDELGTPRNDKQAVLGISFENPSHISDQINTSNILSEQNNSDVSQITDLTPKQILSGLLIVSTGLVILASLGLVVTFLKPIPK